MEALTTLNLPTPDARAAVRQDLEAAMQAFVSAGGKVQEVDGFECTRPLPGRREVPRSTAPIKRNRGLPKKHRITLEREQELVAMIRQAAAAGQSQTAAREAAGIGQLLFMSLCLENDIRFVKAGDARQIANRERAKTSKAKRDELAPKVAAYAHMGIIACAALLKISDGHVRRIARENGIVMKGCQ